MDQQEGDTKNAQQESAPHSGGGIPLLPQPSLWHHSPFIGGHDQQAETSSYHQEDFFNMLSNVELLSAPPPFSPPLLPPLPLRPPLLPSDIGRVSGFEQGESSGTKRASDVVQVPLPHTQREASTQEVDRENQQRPPRTRRRRSAQVHNLSERTRRSRINEKIRALKELIPDCNKADKASVLADAIEYIKFLQQQVQAKGTYQSMVVPYYWSYSPLMGMSFQMGMCNSAYAARFPMLPFPQVLNPLGESRFLHSTSQLQYPSLESVYTTNSQPSIETTTTATTSTTGPLQRHQPLFRAYLQHIHKESPALPKASRILKLISTKHKYN